MGVFTFENAYTTPDPLIENNEEEEFDIDSNVSDADLLELKQELGKLRSEQAQRDLADATIAIQQMTLQRWKVYVNYSIRITVEADFVCFCFYQIL